MSTALKRMTFGFVIVIGIVILFSTLTQAQQQLLSVEDRVTILKDRLKLSDEQIGKITIILEDQREEITTAMNDNRGDREAMHNAVQELVKKTNSRIKEVLTEEQAAKYDKMFKRHRERIGPKAQESGK
jgi:Spy/CpxP family protein refolding chaperone